MWGWGAMKDALAPLDLEFSTIHSNRVLGAADPTEGGDHREGLPGWQEQSHVCRGWDVAPGCLQAAEPGMSREEV